MHQHRHHTHITLLTTTIAAMLLTTGCHSTQKETPPVAYKEKPWRFAGRDGLHLTTNHYDIYTTLKKDALVDTFPQLVEAAFDYYTSLVPPARQPQKRMRVLLFATRPEWVAFTKHFTGPRAQTFLKIRNGGYSYQGVTVIQYVSHPTTFPLLAHEGFHQYLHHYVNPSVPAWINEGLAVICEGQRWGSNDLREFDPWYNPVRRNRLSDSLVRNRLIPLRTILETHAGRVIHETSQTVGTYYAQVWALMLFLQEGQNGKYAPGLQRLLQALGSPDLEQHARAAHIWSDRQTYNLGEGLFRCFITDNLERVENEYIAFIKSEILAGN